MTAFENKKTVVVFDVVVVVVVVVAVVAVAVVVFGQILRSEGFSAC